jgi:hypothetical protein
MTRQHESGTLPATSEYYLASGMRRFDNTEVLAQAKQPTAQANLNGEVHNWYRLRLGYSDHLVSKLLDEFSLTSDDRVLDPFAAQEQPWSSA